MDYVKMRFVIFALLNLFVQIEQIISQCLTQNDSFSFEPTSDLSMIVEFELELFKMMHPVEGPDNFVFSPYSIWNALVMAYFGSAGETEYQLHDTLVLDDKVTTLRKWRKLEYLYRMRLTAATNNTFVLANKAFFDKFIFVRTCMENILHNEIETLDFSHAEEAADYINAFVSETTEGTIQGLVNPNDVRNAQMVLANAAYFKGVWQSPFDPLDTQPRPFVTLDGREVLVDMMMTEGEFKCGFDDYLGVDILELPYDGEILSMLLFLPYEATPYALNDFLNKLTIASLATAIDHLYLIDVHVLMPRFTIETSAGDSLIQALTAMGLTSPFDPTSANFTYFAPYNHVSLDNSIHKSYISVNEEGTEASSATAFVSVKTFRGSFRCDKSFFFAIKDNETKNLIFLGLYKGPADAGVTPYDYGAPPEVDPLLEQVKIDWVY